MRFVSLIAAFLVALPIVAAGPAHAQREFQSSDDPYVHPATGARFPARIGDHERTRMVEYGDRGAEFSVGYNLPMAETERPWVTIYLFPNRVPEANPSAPPIERCAGEYSIADSEIIRAYPGAERIGDPVEVAAPAGFAGTAQIGRYRFTLRGRDHQSDLYVYCVPNGNWVVKLRASWTGASDYRPEALGVLAGVGLPAQFPADPATVVASR